MLTTPLPLYALVLICWLICSLVMVLVYYWARRLVNAGVVDIFWAFNFPIIAFVLFELGPGWFERRALLAALVILTGLRLGWHLGVRVLSHADVEEGRYQELRRHWGPRAERKFFWFFQAQALSNVVLSIPFFIITQNPSPFFSSWEYAGIALWLVAFVGEAIADRQLAAFKRRPSNRGKVCSVGLWNYSRHPNYFFEWLIWMAWFLFAMGSEIGIIAILSPASILYLLLKVTGIPATEEQSIRSKGAAYKNYQRQTSVFIPWFKKHA